MLTVSEWDALPDGKKYIAKMMLEAESDIENEHHYRALNTAQDMLWRKVSH